ncbi:MAG: protein-L-isoaspartate O-methyltransferase [Candidatus Micrarchaeota archaeon]|nr:protein-L-isoaspartate O-methyltransferase [Candidatus Micrarchaeota archaeon]
MGCWEEVIQNLISCGYLRSEKVIQAMRKIPRADFLPPEARPYACEDRPLPIGFGQTISAPHMYAIMLEAAQVQEGNKVLEVGAGSGYGAALLSFLAGKKGKVYSIEVVPQLAEFARKNIQKSKMHAVIIEGDGKQGYPEEAPYDRILVTAAAISLPAPLLLQLAEGGRMLAPIGGLFQELVLLEKTKSGILQRSLLPVLFVPLR